MAITAIQNWDHDGHLTITGEGTLKRYNELKEQQRTVSLEKLGLFAAFNYEQFEEGYNKLVELGHIKDGDKVYHLFAGCYGSKKGCDRLIAFYEDINKSIRSECDPQEVYYHEYNDYECCIAHNGDYDAMKQIILTFGEEAARKIKRFNPTIPLDKIIKDINRR